MSGPEDVVKTNSKNLSRFLKFCEENGISLDDEDDWNPWWECWHAGYMSAFQDANEQNEYIQKRPGEN